MTPEDNKEQIGKSLTGCDIALVRIAGNQTGDLSNTCPSPLAACL